MDTPQVIVVGGGLAGCECAWQLAERGVVVQIREMKPLRRTPAQSSDALAELVCSNSFRSDNPLNAIGLLHEELRALGSLVLRLADRHRVPAGDALAVDRDLFSADVERHVRQHPMITVVAGEVTALPLALGVPVVVATGPLTSDALAAQLVAVTGQERLAFYDAIAPIVAAESIAMPQVFAASRWGKGDGDDYLNCPMDKAQYLAFVEAVVAAETLPLQDFELGVRYFPGCQPIEVVAQSGPKSLRFGPMKPTGLDDPRTGRWPYAVVQLRAENRHKTAYNLVGFQTKMRQAEQRRVLGMIPGLGEAEFLRYGSVHRNTFLDSPRLLDDAMRLRSLPQLRFAGQITGVEGYIESTASGWWTALALDAELRGVALAPPPADTALGALVRHVVDTTVPQFQPSNLHFGLFEPLDDARDPQTGKKRDKPARKQAMCDRARASLRQWHVATGRTPACG
ncbi:MAG: methylenetetrahydrofolate--tRNA-(uracil(54)-C(5))-methyltransferase (FADH(2)-oxidizing) TrmFO [Deltaproteobacteria bacterium]|nr:methylenetetrahydrofolate--tRNA-(uracil(54)-C(5))-methyltransferase (FADH(2)-oxidizing) TrmFO [Deltaproteobacteria bacterium]